MLILLTLFCWQKLTLFLQEPTMCSTFHQGIKPWLPWTKPDPTRKHRKLIIVACLRILFSRIMISIQTWSLIFRNVFPHCLTVWINWVQLYQEPITRSLHLPYKPYATTFARIFLFLETVGLLDGGHGLLTVPIAGLHCHAIKNKNRNHSIN